MRRPVDPDRIERLMAALGAAAESPGRVYFTGGATAVLQGWRPSTIDVDLIFVPEEDALYREVARLKDRLEVNVEIVSPAHFLPELPGWQERSLYIGRRGKLDFYHYDPYAQALSKIERGHMQDIEDVRAMLRWGLIDREKLRDLFAAIEPDLHRFPAVDPASLSRAVERLTQPLS
jgi:Nucleotidyltransferase of unknown function (DUF6036)